VGKLAHILPGSSIGLISKEIKEPDTVQEHDLTNTTSGG
jgi:hypothetical protein